MAGQQGGLFGGGGLLGRPGLLGGLAAGFLGAGLFGMLFGHGLFGGLGGFSSLFGLLLQLALVAFVARLAWSWFQRRNAPAFAGATMFRGAPNDVPGMSSGLGGGGMASGAPVAVGQADFDVFEQHLREIQAAYSAEDLNALRQRVTPEMVSYFAQDLAANSSRGVVNRVSEVKLLQGDLAESWSEGDMEYATVAMRFALVDQTIDRATGQVVEGSATPTEATELWTFTRTRGGHWLLSAIQQA
jgi:predicted lipid-binding transport protein (Tim44 family)